MKILHGIFLLFALAAAGTADVTIGGPESREVFPLSGS
jgi:hypothetical protein